MVPPPPSPGCEGCRRVGDRGAAGKAPLRKTIIPTIYYLAVIGIMGLLAVYVVGVTDPLMGGG